MGNLILDYPQQERAADEVIDREQERQGKQIDSLETSKNDTFKFWLRTILAAVATGLVGYALAMFIK